MSLVCLGCGNNLTERHCGTCNSKNDILDIPISAYSSNLALKQKPISEEDGIKAPEEKEYYTIHDILLNNIPCRSIQGFEFIGELPDCFSMMLFGLPGSGKSTFALRFAGSLAYNNRVTLYVSEEEAGASFTLKKKIIDNGLVDTPNFLLIDQYKGKAHLRKFIEHYNVKNVIIDSITSINLKPEEIKWYRDYVVHTLGGILILICHARKDEKPKYKGDSSVGHLVDIVCLVNEGLVTTDKNRLYYKKNACYKIWED